VDESLVIGFLVDSGLEILLLYITLLAIEDSLLMNITGNAAIISRTNITYLFKRISRL
jgi:hypothetical protein